LAQGSYSGVPLFPQIQKEYNLAPVVSETLPIELVSPKQKLVKRLLSFPGEGSGVA